MLKRKYCAIWRFCCDYKESDAVKSICEKEGGGKKYFRAACHAELYEYAKDISFDDTCNTIQTIMDAIMA